MKRAILVQGCFAKEREGRCEIAEPDSAPRRSANHRKRVVKNEPAEIGGDASAEVAIPQVEAFQSLAAEKEHDREQRKQRGEANRDPRRRCTAQSQGAAPKRA